MNRGTGGRDEAVILLERQDGISNQDRDRQRLRAERNRYRS